MQLPSSEKSYMPTLVNGSDANMVDAKMVLATIVVNKATLPLTVQKVDRHLEGENVGNQGRTHRPEIQIDPRLPTGFYYVRDVFSESQEETVKKVLHDNRSEKYHGRSVQHFGHAYIGPGKVTATSPIPEEFSSILQTYNAALERLGLSHPSPNQITGTMYLPGEGIGYHRDDRLLGDPVSIFGSQSDTTTFFENTPNGDSFRIRLFSRSLLVLAGAAATSGTTGYPDGGKTKCLG